MGNKNIAGIDVDKKALHVAFRDGDSVKIEEFPNDLHGVEELVAFLKAISVELVVLESTGSYWIKLSETLSASNIGCVVLNPADVKRSGVHKSDDRDAVWLLHVGEIGVFQTSYVPPGDVRRLRDIVRARFKAADRVASAKQRIINLLNARGVRLPRGYGMNSQTIRIILKNAVKRGEYEAVEDALKAFFRDVVTALDEADLMLLSLYLTELETLESLLGKYDELIRVYAEPYMEKIELLMTVPGVGFLTAVSLLAEIGTVSRFPSPANLASYAGLVPRLN